MKIMSPMATTRNTGVIHGLIGDELIMEVQRLSTSAVVALGSAVKVSM